MTTIIASLIHQQMAADSRVTEPGLHFETTKIRRIRDSLVGFAGSVADGIEFLDWLKYGGEENYEPSNTFEAIVLTSKTIVCFEGNATPIRVRRRHWYAIGSGAQGALVALDMGADPREAIRRVRRWDTGTGGRIEVLCLNR